MENLYTIKPSGVLRFQVKILLVLLVLDLCAISLEYYLREHGNTSLTGTYSFKYYVTGMFAFDGERNLPAYFSTINLLVSAFLLFLISQHVKYSARREHYKKWFFMGCIFAWLGMDELFSIHELLVKPSRMFLKQSLEQDNLGLLNFAWFVPYVLLFMVVGLYFVKFILGLPKKTLYSFMGAGTLFISGAVGMEMVGGDFIANQGHGLSLVYKLCTSVEEVLEMTGIIFFIYSLLQHMEQQLGMDNIFALTLPRNKSQNTPSLRVIKEEPALSATPVLPSQLG
ncbi:hypothetical protein ACFSC6_22190 [Rufibacter sediminis]|uniref:Multidrug transporter n=1 Tax=Rufibacter sediminis TaxID=2762756 RepID=A0ABR6VUL9_9BACT|nr:hypothetical protein [Rufibacter sediminis]MBC3540851.1 hypothetical protein [Rufibacter sediminis]